MIPGIIEYVGLRLIRRFLLGDRFLLRWGHCLPYYRTNANQADPDPVCDRYARAIGVLGLPAIAERTLLEIGSGATDAVGIELLRRGMVGAGGQVILHEPYAEWSASPDGSTAAELRRRIRRTETLDGIEPGSVDLIVSHSVLEHVREPQALMHELRRLLAPGGWMIHVVDYRDHFFKYPYHFLLFSQSTWERWLDPGDLPRWRLTDHLRIMAAAGFIPRVLESASLPEAFARVAGSIAPEFDAGDPDLAITAATIAAQRSL